MKISREDCLKQYPIFPLRHYDEVRDEEDFFYPKVISGQWVALNIKTAEELTIELSKQLTSLIGSLGIEQLIFLGDTDQNWISKQGLKRKDYRPFTKAVSYFIQYQIDANFNGGVVVSTGNLETFLQHFYTLIRCDASLPYFHFIDNKPQILGTIHYSGQIRIDRFNEKANHSIEGKIIKTGFREVVK